VLDPQTLLDGVALVSGSPPIAFISASYQVPPRVSAVYRFAGGLGSPAMVPATDQYGTTWRIFPGQWQTDFDAIALINQDFQPIDVFIRQIDFHGAIVEQVQIAAQLPRYEKLKYT